MLGALVRHLLRGAASALCAILVCFFVLHALPGDPADRLDSPLVPVAQAERNRRALGLDRPLGVQLWRTLSSYARGDLGISFSERRPVAEVLGDALPATLLLGSSALALAYGGGLTLALLLLGLPRRGRAWAHAGLLVLGTAPRFWLGSMLVYVLHGLAGAFPASHAAAAGASGAVDARHLVLPVLALALPAACLVARYQLSVMADRALGPEVRAARARGLAGLALLLRHVLRPTLGLAAGLFAVDLPVVVSGAIVVEVLFAWPGVGRLTAQAVLESDYPLALAAVLLAACAVLAGRLAAELVALAVPGRRPVWGTTP